MLALLALTTASVEDPAQQPVRAQEGWDLSYLPGGAVYGVEVIARPGRAAVGEEIQRIVAAGARVFTSDRGEDWQAQLGPESLGRVIGTDSGVFFGVDRKGNGWRSNDIGRPWASVRVKGDAPARFLAVSEYYLKDSQALAITTEDWRLFRFDRVAGQWIEAVLRSDESHQVGAAGYSPIFEQDETVFAGAETGVYRSQNGGQTWSLVATRESGAPFFGPEAGPAEGQGMLISPDYGDDLRIRYDIDDRSLLAWNAEGLYRSDDAGENWRRLPLEADQIRDVEVSNGWPADPAILVAVAHPGKVGAVSRDGGKSWQWIDGPAGGGVVGTAVAVARDFGVRGFHIRYSDATKSIINLPFTLKTVSPFMTRPYLPVEIWPGTREAYLATDGDGLWRTADGGKTWPARLRDASSASLFSAQPTDVVSLPGSGGQAYIVGTEASGLYRSEDGGLTWRAQPGLPRGHGQEIHQLLVSPTYASDGILMAAAESGLWISRDRGQNWTRSSLAAPVRSAAISPAFGSDRTLVAAGHISRDAGQNWTPLPTVGGFAWTAAEFSPRFATDRSIWIARDLPPDFPEDARDPLWVSKDAGDSWQLIDNSNLRRRPLSQIHAVAVGADPLRIYLATLGGLYGSVDDGQNWRRIQGAPGQEISDISSVVLTSPVVTAVIAVVGEREVSWSTNRGNDWQDGPTSLRGQRGVALSDDGSEMMIARSTDMLRHAGIELGAD
jgi:photosystem II stability/assembly factor-like uncharacterized protein